MSQPFGLDDEEHPAADSAPKRTATVARPSDHRLLRHGPFGARTDNRQPPPGIRARCHLYGGMSDPDHAARIAAILALPAVELIELWERIQRLADEDPPSSPPERPEGLWTT
jgi:hypothetical protein